MATITTTASLIRQYNAFTGLSALERSQSGIARAEIVYYGVNDNWAGPGSGNDRIYSTGVLDLPKDFGYVLTDAFVKVDSDSSNDVFMEAEGVLDIFVGGSLGPQINLSMPSYPSRQTSANPSTQSSGSGYNTTILGAQGVMMFQLRDKPSSLIYPFGSQAYTTTPNPASQWRLQFGEAVQNGPSYDVTSYVRFLQYDIDQSYNYVV